MEGPTFGQKILAFILGSLGGILILFCMVNANKIGPTSFWTIVQVCWVACFISEFVLKASVRKIAIDAVYGTIFTALCCDTITIQPTAIETVKPLMWSVIFSTLLASMTTFKQHEATRSTAKKAFATVFAIIVGETLLFWNINNGNIYETKIIMYLICFLACFAAELATNTAAVELGLDMLICLIAIPFGLGMDSWQYQPLFKTMIWLSIPIWVVSIGSAFISF